jgi:hypothetical protein
MQAKFLILLLTIPFISNAAEPLVRNNACPSGYRSSGLYCIPGPASPPAIDRVGNCPSGFHRSSNYCLANSASSPTVIQRVGVCPSGWTISGAYCKKNP